MKTVLIFGATGSIGNHIFTHFSSEKYIVIGTTTNPEKVSENMIHVTTEKLDNLLSIQNIDIIVWTQGHNFNDNIETFDISKFQKIIDGNVSFILATLNCLLKNNKINNNSKMVIISSIWENYSRENKLSYSISKSSLSSLVKNVAFDLSKKNILINNVLPGVIDNEMSRNTLAPEQFNYIKKYMNFDRLITVDDIFRTVKFLVVENTGITGQSITVDLGFTTLRKYN
jgi:3-oxoacyl-[acyl-carrier protein] reductase